MQQVKVTSDTVRHYLADIRSANDYYPFGMLMPGRKFNAGSFRYGFNGQEMSNEIKGVGNSYTAEFWEYDPRLGRRVNLDPKPNTGISAYGTFANNPIFHSDLLGDTISPSRTIPMNFIILPTAEQRKKDIQSHGGKWNSPYWADWRRAKKIERKSKGATTLIYSDEPLDAFSQIVNKLGEGGYVANILIDYHRSQFDASSKGNDEFYKKLSQGYAGSATSCYLGACWAGGSSINANLTENASTLLDGAKVYGHKAQASAYSFFFSGHFSRYVGLKEGDYRQTEEFGNVGLHVVSFYSTKVNRVVSVEIFDKVRIKNNGQIHSRYTTKQLEDIPIVNPSGGIKIGPILSGEIELPPPVEQ